LNKAFDLLNQLRRHLNLMHRGGVFGHLLQQFFLAFGPDLVVTIKAGVSTA